MKKMFLSVLALSLLLSNSFGEDSKKDSMDSKVRFVQPSAKSIKKAKRALVWCTNNLQRIEEKKIWGDQVKSAKEKYFSKRAGLEDEPNIMEYIPRDNEKPFIAEEKYKQRFADKTYREMVTICDEGMMKAYHEYFNSQFKPSNIAEEKIATYPSEATRNSMLKEQDVGKKAGLSGVNYGIIDTMASIADNKYSVKEAQKFLIKPSVYDKYWVLTNIKAHAVAYEMWSGQASVMVIMMRNKNREYVDGARLPLDTYYKLIKIEPSVVTYQGTPRETSLFVFEEYIK